MNTRKITSTTNSFVFLKLLASAKLLRWIFSLIGHTCLNIFEERRWTRRAVSNWNAENLLFHSINKKNKLFYVLELKNNRYKLFNWNSTIFFPNNTISTLFQAKHAIFHFIGTVLRSSYFITFIVEFVELYVQYYCADKNECKWIYYVQEITYSSFRIYLSIDHWTLDTHYVLQCSDTLFSTSTSCNTILSIF